MSDKAVNVIESTLFDFISYQDEQLFQWPREKIDDFQIEYFLDAFEYHYSKCIPYKSYCDFCGINPQILKESKDLAAIPQIPTLIFKNLDLVSVPKEKITKKCTSSGTQGIISSIYRDDISLDRLLCSISTAIKDFYDMEQDRAVVANLGPDTEEAGEVWFTYITSIVDLIFDTINFVKNGELLYEQLFEFLNNRDKSKRLLLLGPPILFKYFLDYLKANFLTIKLNNDDLVVTAGGWKKYSGEKIERQAFETLLIELLGASRESIFDVFNQVELNTVLFECPHKKKHIPPWIKVLVRDPVTMQPVNDGEMGVLSYLDASSTSYPCFIISEDIGRVSRGCSCGRTGQTLEIIRRVNKVETKGCAIKIDSKILNKSRQNASR